MSSLNINGSNDPFYRYKMPAVEVTMQRKQGGTTVVNNTVEICESIRRDAKAVAKFLSKSLGQPVQVKAGCWALKGEIPAAKIQEFINAYINKYVLCGTCGNPQTIFETETKLRCKSCGNSTKV